jgi:exodeoxyribonuclease VII small subunit
MLPFFQGALISLTASAFFVTCRTLPVSRSQLLEMVCSKISGYTSILSTMSKKSTPDGQPASFEDAMAELEQLVARMEAGELPLEASVAAYKRGSELVKFCAGQLDKVDSQVKVLEGEMLKPFAADVAPEADE